MTPWSLDDSPRDGIRDGRDEPADGAGGGGGH
jgi:hypothetical protein